MLKFQLVDKTMRPFAEYVIPGVRHPLGKAA
jgi:hypothetical protein